MSGVILTLLERPDASRGMLAASERLADLMGGARIDVLVVRMPPEATILPSEEVLTKRQITLVKAREEAREAQVIAQVQVPERIAVAATDSLNQLTLKVVPDPGGSGRIRLKLYIFQVPTSGWRRANEV